jgi:uncharacterized LabA/DUF88 family protein
MEEMIREMRSRERVCVFVDNGNLFTAIQSQPGRKIDYIKLLDFVGAGRAVNCARFYYGESSLPGEDIEAFNVLKKRQSFYYVLQRAGYSVVPSIEYDRLDLDVVYDMCAKSREGIFDTFVLIAGSENYAKIISKIRQDTGISVEVAFFGNNCSQRLRQSANRFINLENQEEIFRSDEGNV